MGIYILSYIDVSQSTDDIFPKGLRPPKHFKLDLEGRLEIISTTK